MIFERKMIHLKDGRTCVLRPAEAEDSKAMIECLRTVSSETPFLLRNEDEVTISLKKAYWGLGIASALMEYAFLLAKEIGYEQVELEVVDGNDRQKAFMNDSVFRKPEKTAALRSIVYL